MKTPLPGFFGKKQAPARRAAAAGYTHPVMRGAAPVPLPAGVRNALLLVVGKWLAVRVAGGTALLLTALPLLALAQTTADWLFNLPLTARALLLAVDAAVFLWLFATRIVKPLRRRRDLRAAALLVERARPEFKTSLISTVELCANPGVTAGGAELARQLAARTAALVAGRRLAREVVPARPLKSRLCWLAATLAVTAGVFFFFRPQAVVLLQRVLLANVALPTKTRVVPVSGDLHIVAGADVELAARAGGVVPGAARVIVAYQDGRRETLPVAVSPAEPGLFALRLHNILQPFRYHFEINDGVGETFTVSTRVLPALARVKFTQIYPAYTGIADAEMTGGNLALLAGGKLRVEAEATRPLKAAVLKMPALKTETPLTVSGSGGASLKVELPADREQLASFSIHLTDTGGAESLNDPEYRVDIQPDRAPVVTLLQPKKEKTTVLPGDQPALVFSVRDDHGLRKVAVRYQIFRPDAMGRSVAAESGELPLTVPAGVAALKQTFELNLARMQPPLRVGDAVSCWIEATDNNNLARQQPAASRRKMFDIVSAEAKRAEFVAALAEKAEDIDRAKTATEKVGERIENAMREEK
ncbi:MAG: hypothetical protein LBK60_04895 [Verrucomicrobiales bacterium]|jgi:hypothetical protein|nr:hypothetical protein [Verrucomicrobiales bacterium]